GTSAPISSLPFIDSASNVQVAAELLARPTALGETTALHVRLPPPHNQDLANSLVRIVGPVDRPQILFRSDALVRLGVTSSSPGKDFFTTFSTLSSDQLATLQRNHDEIASGKFGRTTDESVVFSGRAPVARTNNPVIDPAKFKPGSFVPVNLCSTR